MKTYTITRYGARYWAVLNAEHELICVTLYKKGAIRVVSEITANN